MQGLRMHAITSSSVTRINHAEARALNISLLVRTGYSMAASFYTPRPAQV